jgi:hypothetical protein
MSETFTVSNSETYTEANVKAVMQNTYEDIIGFANRKLVDYSRIKSWIEDLVYLLNKRVLKSFEIQLYNSSGEKFKSYRYEVNIYGYINSGSSSGGINYFEIPDGTIFGLFADIDFSHTKIEEVKKYLYEQRGWGNNGSAMQGNSSFERSHSSGSLELKRYVINK